MRLTILGSSASYADAGRACAGHVVEEGATRILLDCGHGVLAHLARVSDPLDLDAAFITHGHPDHIVDLYALQALLRYAPDGPAPALPLYGPPDLLERMSCLLSEQGGRELGEAFVFQALGEGVQVDVGPLAVEARDVSHSFDAVALVVRAGEASLCYSGDSRAGEALVAAARGCDVLLAEATLPEAYAGRAPHMTAREAAGIARDAGAGTLVLTHVWPTTDRGAILAEAQDVFDGTILVAEEFAQIEVG